MNKVILMGRLTRDPELRYTSNNLAVCSFTLAVNRGFAKQGEERQADFIPIVVWDKQAEFCSKYFTKGLQVAVVGRIQVRSWDDNEGKKRYTTEVVANEVYFADSKKSDIADKVQDPQLAEPADGFYPLEEDDELPF
ncbi:single-stranded DNA-binding protein [Acetivibrio clariflavus]|uniref:Single-stranded DNA-binding protein n=1 Tax=Acetivibrio clariflavus (strain DSM 19732 / NBRC 101661 / EBR45) TaxID=720554 RepID=G8LTQ4_ACECE|nr:single-stranded DNA-binding protein [Acetivibrio clariflavus]AEV70564.1 single stranded DNA-binding protein [Acetivibrio clariflavus DSM 19732]